MTGHGRPPRPPPRQRFLRLTDEEDGGAETFEVARPLLRGERDRRLVPHLKRGVGRAEGILVDLQQLARLVEAGDRRSQVEDVLPLIVAEEADDLPSLDGGLLDRHVEVEGLVAARRGVDLDVFVGGGVRQIAGAEVDPAEGGPAVDNVGIDAERGPLTEEAAVGVAGDGRDLDALAIVAGIVPEESGRPSPFW